MKMLMSVLIFCCMGFAGPEEIFRQAAAQWSLEKLVAAEKTLNGLKSSDTAAYWTGVTRFHILTLYAFSEKKKKGRAKKYADITLDGLEEAAEGKFRLAEINALQSAVLGIKITLKPYLGPFKGPKSMKYLKAALAMAPHNPRVNLFAGQLYLNMPKMAGGSAEKALDYLLKAEKGFETDTAWGKGTCLAFTGATYKKLGKTGEAEKYFKRALETDPGNPLARSGLNDLND